MNEQMYDDIQLEKHIKATFGVSLSIDAVVARRMPVSRSAAATLFLNEKKQLFAYINTTAPLTLGDVQKVIGRMGLKADSYLPPAGRVDYFEVAATRRFQEIFPGRRVTNAEDLIYYRKLVPYRPALVLIGEVTNGMIYQYDADAATSWRPSVKFMYRRIRTS